MAKNKTLLMCSLNFTALLIGYFCVSAVLAEDELESIDSNSVVRGEVQSCRGCQLKRLPEVRSFIYDDLPKYSGVEFHPIQGAAPQLVLFDDSDKELTRIDLADLSRAKCNSLVRKWFTLKQELESSSEDQSRDEL